MHQIKRFLVTTSCTVKGKVNKLIHKPIIAQLNSFRNSD